MKTPLFLLIMLMAIGTLGHDVAYAEDAAVDASSAGDPNVLVDTMNQLLEENRRTRTQLTLLTDENKELSRENNVLRAQVRRSKQREDEMAAKGAQPSEEMQGELKALRESVQRLETENQELRKTQETLRADYVGAETENRSLRATAKGAIQESDRDEYVSRIQRAEAAAERAAHEIASTQGQNEHLRGQSAEAFYKLGNSAFDIGDYETAVRHYLEAVKWNPHNSWTHHNLGIIYDFYLHRDPEALYHYNEYLKFKPSSDDGNKIRERILEMELKKNMIPGEPLKKYWMANDARKPR
ncbi:MAG: tetratricopeptide repeat protein [Candidatus Omnitrophota bacterium]|nr:tetratricopeptide repeat protein [Candidatus Omnitrophota bacterium]